MPIATPIKPWQPTEGVTAHNGEAFDPAMVFFHEPPADIGPVLTAYTTLKAGQKPRLWLQIVLALLCAAPLLALTWGFFREPDEDSRVAAYICLAIGLGVFAFCFCKFGFRRVCTYTGGFGTARYTLKNSLEASPKEEIFLFDKAADLRTGSTRHYYNGIYTGTSYFFDWHDEKGKRVFRLKGTYRSSKSTPKAKDAYWFAASAESAWTQYKAVWAQHQLESTGYVSFTYGAGNEVRIGQGFFEFVVKGQTYHINADEIKHIQLNNGQFYIHHKEAKWFSGKGKFNFPYGALSNARLFIHSMDKLAGYRFQ